ncbi:MAG: hypothetical protein VKJ64_00070 [Leptolyngbyaceae bacterium]|nr:hypothetical protein [Leptolyngbyaceae bacterium]
MSTPTYRQLLAQVSRFGTTLSLHLPIHESAIASQIRNIRSIYQDLEATQLKVRLLESQSWRLMQRDQYRQLDQLLHRLIHEAVNMLLLAEEFATDPAGTLSCLREVNRRKDRVMQDIYRLSNPDRSLVNLSPALAVTQGQSNHYRAEVSA